MPFTKHISVLGILICALAGAAPAQTPVTACEPVPQVKAVLDQFPDVPTSGTDFAAFFTEQAQKLQEITKQFPEDVFVHNLYITRLRYAHGRKQTGLSQEYERRLASRPNETAFLYLYGRTLSEPEKAIPQIEKALEQEPHFPLAHFALARTYQSPRLLDNDKSLAHLREYLRLCPSNIDGYQLLYLVHAPQDELEQYAAKLRERVTAMPLQNRLRHYRLLWTLELNATPKWEQPERKKHIADEVKALRALERTGDLAWLAVLREGYRILDDAASGRWAEERIKAKARTRPKSPSEQFTDALDQWRAQNRVDALSASYEDMQQPYRRLFAASDEWVRRWPDQAFAWQERLSALKIIDDVNPSDVEAAADGALRAAENFSDDYFVQHLRVTIAGIYAKHSVRLDQVERLVSDGLAAMEERFEQQSRTRPNQGVLAAHAAQSKSIVRWRAATILADLYTQTGNAAGLRESIAKMRSAYREGDSENTWRDPQLLMYQAHLAKLEGRTAEALRLYQQGVEKRPVYEGRAESSLDNRLITEARETWLESGGSERDWDRWLSTAPGVTFSKQTLQRPRWMKTERELPDFELEDLTGRTWTLDDLKGKVSFILVWDTRFGDQLLPPFQQLYDKLEGRSDTLLLTFNGDWNTALVEPYLAKHTYTFPVIPARSYVHKLDATRRNLASWIIDPEGVLRRESEQYIRGPEWVEAVVEELEKVRNQ